MLGADSRDEVEAGEGGAVLPDNGGNETGFWGELDPEVPSRDAAGTRLLSALPEAEEGELPEVCRSAIGLDDESKCRGASNFTVCGASWEPGGAAGDGGFEPEAGLAADCGDDEFESDDPAEPWLLGTRLLTGVSRDPDGVDDLSWVL